jgi:hypothetical protein
LGSAGLCRRLELFTQKLVETSRKGGIMTEEIWGQWREELKQLTCAARRFQGRANIEQKLTEAIDCMYAITDDGASESDSDSDSDSVSDSDADWNDLKTNYSASERLEVTRLCLQLETFTTQLAEASQSSDVIAKVVYQQWREDLTQMAHAALRFQGNPLVERRLVEAHDCLRAIIDEDPDHVAAGDVLVSGRTETSRSDSELE